MSELHIHAEAGEIAPTVLLPGDPDRANYIAETFLENPKRYTTYRHLYGYTGSYQGVPVSVQTSGMGCPSLAIVAEEVIRLGAKRLIRVGTAGIVAGDVQPGDLIVASGANSNAGTTRQYLAPYAVCGTYAHIPDFHLTQALAQHAPAAHVGLIQTDDAFYSTTPTESKALSDIGVLAVEMEAAALFLLGALRRVETGCILVASNRIGDSTFVDPEVLKRSVKAMSEAALNAVVSLEDNG